MSMYKYLREAWKKPSSNFTELYKQKLLQFRKEPATIKVDRPTRLDRARSLGYKAKQGFIIVRRRVTKGGRKRSTDRGGRRSKHFRIKKIVDVNLQREAEQRAHKKFPNCNVLNSYFVGEDGIRKWYEIIMVDIAHPAILRDTRVNFLSTKNHSGRVNRGLTLAGKRARGLLHKGTGAEKFRPSKTQNLRTRKKI